MNNPKGCLTAVAIFLFIGVISGIVNNITGKTNSTFESTRESESQTIQAESISQPETEKEKIKYDSLQSVFLDVDSSTGKQEIENLIKKYNLLYTTRDYNGNPKKTTYKIAFSDSVAKQDHAAEGDYLEVSFNSEDGSLTTAEYFNSKTFMVAFFYNYGTYWSFREETPGKYSGYYYEKPGDNKGGITIKYSNGNNSETGYHSVKNAEKALLNVIKN